MSSEKLEPLPADLSALLESERDAPGISPAELARLARRVEQSLGVPVSGNSPARVPPSPNATRASSGFLAGKIPFGAAMFLVGALSGAALTAALSRPPPARVVYLTRAQPAPTRSDAATPTPPALAVPTPPAAPLATADPAAPQPAARHAPESVATSTRTNTPAPAPALARSEGTTLRAERVALETARMALARRQPQAALAALDRHAQRFPRGELEEEREVLRVQALVVAERYPEARASAARFVARFPQSLLRPAIDASVRSIP